ncbi:MAG TPA: thioredoxin domain-containing protein [Acidocella sp.]|nr:thioredoxin domain-containing protein [Acidocella sp.]
MLHRRSFCLGFAALFGAGTAHAEAVPTASSLVQPYDPVLGNPKGDVTVVDFYDIRCPPCRAMDVWLDKLLAADPGIRYVPVDYPILGAPSQLGTEALFAAQLQGKYEPFRKFLMTEVAPPTLDAMQAEAVKLSLDWSQMQFDMNGDAVAQHISKNLDRGATLNLDGIPALFVGPIFVQGALGYDDMVSVVAMARAKQQKQALATGGKVP